MHGCFTPFNTSLEPLGHQGTRLAFVKCTSEWTERIPLLICFSSLILIGSTIFQLQFIDIVRTPMHAFSFFLQLDSGIHCLWNAFL